MMTDQELAGPYKVNLTQIFGHPDGRARCSIEGFPLELLVKAEDANSVCDLLNIAHERGKIASREADRKEIERLTAIVDKLDETEDGVPMVPGMQVFGASTGNSQMAPWTDEFHIVMGYSDQGGEWPYPLVQWKFYSTRELAQAALTTPRK